MSSIDKNKPTPEYILKFRSKKEKQIQEKFKAKAPKILPSLPSSNGGETLGLTPSQVKILGNSIIFLISFTLIMNLQLFFKNKPLGYYPSNSLMDNISRIFILNDKLYIIFAVAYGLQSLIIDMVLPWLAPGVKGWARLSVRVVVVLFLGNLCSGYILR